MALTESREQDRLPDAAGGFAARLRAWLADPDHRSLAQRVASAAFLIRVVAAGLAFLSQVLLARWMGAAEFGIYVYVSTWVMVIGGIVDLGIASSAQRFIPQYSEKGEWALLRGFLFGSRWLTFWIAAALAVAGFLLIHAFADSLGEETLIPLSIACLILPVYGVMHVQDGIARSFNWANVALLPPFVVRQVIVIGLMGAAFAFDLRTDATAGIVIAAISIWVCAIGQYVLLGRKLVREVPHGGRSYDIPRWIAVSLPMFVVDALYVLLMYVDVLILKQFRPPEDVAVYYAAAKTLSFVSFVYFAVSAACAHRFSEYFAAGDRKRLVEFTREATRWTFWPSLAVAVAVLACGWPLLWLFGERFVSGYYLMFVLAVGLVARASIGPGERFLAMLGQQKACAFAALVALCVNLAFCFALIPSHGALGAALSTTLAFLVETAMIAVIAKRRLGFHLFVFGGRND